MQNASQYSLPCLASFFDTSRPDLPPRIPDYIPFSPAIPAQPVLPSLFLPIIFGSLPEGTVCWVCDFEQDPANGSWRGWALRPDEIRQLVTIDEAAAQGRNTFFVISTFHGVRSYPDTEELAHLFTYPGRRESHFAATFAIVLDDVGVEDAKGSKVGWGSIPRGVVPTWAVETSPGNNQLGYALTVACDNPRLIAALLGLLVEKGLKLEADPGMKGVTRYVRLPAGCNTKAKYGEPFRHRCWHWRPDVRYTIEQIMAMFGILPEELRAAMEGLQGGRGSGDGEVVELADDPWWDLLSTVTAARGQPKDKGVGGVWIDIECPWRHLHTDQEDTGAAYVVGGGYKCNHGHCEDRSFRDVQRWLMGYERDDDRKSWMPVPEEVRSRSRQLLRTQRFEWIVKEGRLAAAFDGLPLGKDLPPPPPTFAESLADVAGEKVHAAWERVPEQARERMKEFLDLGKLDSGQRREIQALCPGKTALKDVEAWEKNIRAANKEVERADRKTAEEEAERKRRESLVVAGGDALGMRRMEFAMALIASGRLAGPVEGPSANAVPDEGESRIYKIISNLDVILREGCGNVYPSSRLNELSGTMEYVGLDGRVREWCDEDATRLCVDVVHDFGCGFPRTWFVDLMEERARTNLYHPVRAWLARLRWDGIERLEDWLAQVVGCEADLYHGAVGRLMILAAVARVMRPGIKYDHVPILTGGEGILKSTLIREIAGGEEWFDELVVNTHNTSKTLEVAHRKWVLELSELVGLTRAEVATVKEFVSCAVDSYRAPYARRALSRPRQFTMIGSTNEDAFLTSSTGDRRFLPIKCSREIDVALFRSMREQLFAEAVAAFSGGELPYLSKEVAAEAKKVQEEHRVVDPWADEIRSRLTLPDGSGALAPRVPNKTLFEWLEIPVAQRKSHRLANVMRLLGYEPTQWKEGGARVRGYQVVDKSV